MEDRIGWSLVPFAMFVGIKMRVARHLLVVLLVPDKRGPRNIVAAIGLALYAVAPRSVPTRVGAVHHHRAALRRPGASTCGESAGRRFETTCGIRCAPSGCCWRSAGQRPWRHSHGVDHAALRNETVVNADRMRAIDYWVGIPLAWLLTIVYRVQRLIGLAASPVGRPRNILFIQLAEMGTMVVAYPALRKARELYPDATLHFLLLRADPAERGDPRDHRRPRTSSRSTRGPACHSRATRCGSCGRPAVVGIDTVINMEASSDTARLARLSLGGTTARRISPLQPGGSLHRRLADPQSLVQSLTFFTPRTHFSILCTRSHPSPEQQVPRVKRPRGVRSPRRAEVSLPIRGYRGRDLAQVEGRQP